MRSVFEPQNPQTHKVEYFNEVDVPLMVSDGLYLEFPLHLFPLNMKRQFVEISTSTHGLCLGFSRLDSGQQRANGFERFLVGVKRWGPKKNQL